ncbi:DUF3750 domain-containing protein [Accumulibacter sp.]|uniref:DUF3750 domain-containing protein n=1 Tax=Accumulibacter sp. TaxID=2053492 RepID=UPI0025D144FE|nr:DUF3750 domain-containing protein [Accumulibacter sp.]
MIRQLRGGAEVDALIKRLHAAARAYPHNHEYRLWPGPNSNTFVAYLGRAVPALRLDLPPTAIGRTTCPRPLSLPAHRVAVASTRCWACLA